MSFIVAEKPATSVIVQAPAQLPAVVAKNPVSVFQRQDSFDKLMETRGERLAPSSLHNRIFNHTASWGLVAGAATALVGGPMAFFELVPLFLPCVVGGFTAFFGTMLGATVLEDSPSPLSLVSRHNTLRQRDLKFLEGAEAAGPLQQAVDAKLAQRWIARIDHQRVHGDAACADLEDIIAHGKTLHADIQQRAERIVAVFDATIDDNTGKRPKVLDDYRVARIIESVRRLDDADGPACAAELMRTYFKADVPRYRFESHGKSRELYRALRDAMRPKPVVVPALAAPAVNAEPARD